jgi:hypothetical protein
MMNYTCPIQRLTARTHIGRLQVLQCKFLRLATGESWYIGSMQIHKDLRVPFFTDHIGALTTSFE